MAPEALGAATRAGTALVDAAGGWENAMRALRLALPSTCEPLSGIHSRDLDAHIPADLLRYLRTVQRDGVPPRWRGNFARVRAAPHPSVREHLDEAAQSVWECATSWGIN